MHTASPLVREFFERYERSRNTMDAGFIDEQYPDAFTFAGPAGARIAEKPAVMASLSKGAPVPEDTRAQVDDAGVVA
jgi:hypothetical protein